MEVGNLNATLTLNMKEFEQGIDKATTKIDSLSSKLEKSGKKMSSIGKSMTTGITMPLVGIGAAAIKMSTDFNSSMARIATLIPGQTEKVQALKTSIQELAVEYGTATSAIAEGTYEVISAIGDTADTLEYLELATKASVAGSMEVKDAVSLMASTMKGYGDISVDTANKIMNLLFKTVRLGQTTMSELAPAFQDVISSAASMNISIEEVSAAFATLTGVTGNTSIVGTQLKSIMMGLIKPTDQLSATIKELGYNTADDMVANLGLIGSLQALVGTTDGTKQALGELFARSTAIQSILALTGAQADTFTSKLGEMGDETDELTAAFLEQTEGVNATGFAMAQAKQQVVVLMQKLGDALAPAVLKVTQRLSDLIPKVTSLVEGFTELPSVAQDVIIGFAGIVAAMGPVLYMGGKLLVLFSGITKAIAILGPALTTLGVKMGILSPLLSGAPLAASTVPAAILGGLGGATIIGGLGYLAYDLITTAKDTSKGETWGDLNYYEGYNATTDYGMPMDTFEKPKQDIEEIVEDVYEVKGTWTSIPYIDKVFSSVAGQIQAAKDEQDELNRLLNSYESQLQALEAEEYELTLTIEAEEEAIQAVKDQLEEELGTLQVEFAGKFSSQTLQYLEKLQSANVNDEGEQLYNASYDIGQDTGLQFATESLAQALDTNMLKALGFTDEQIEQMRESVKIAGDQLETQNLIHSMAESMSENMGVSVEEQEIAKEYLIGILTSANEYKDSMAGKMDEANKTIADIKDEATNAKVEIQNVQARIDATVDAINELSGYIKTQPEPVYENNYEIEVPVTVNVEVVGGGATSDVYLPSSMAEGGLFMAPTLSWFAEKEPEWAIPSSKLPQFLHNMGGGSMGSMEVVNNNYIQEVMPESIVKRIVEQILREPEMAMRRKGLMI